MYNLSYDEFLREYEESERIRLEIVSHSIQMGCGHCSQCDDYWGCNKCELTESI